MRKPCDLQSDILEYMSNHKETTSFEVMVGLNELSRYNGRLTAHHVGMWMKTLHSRGDVELVGWTSTGVKIWKLTEVSA